MSLCQSRGLWRSGGQWSFSSGPSHSGSSGFPNFSCGYFLSSECIIGIGTLSSWEYPHMGRREEWDLQM